MVFEVNCLKHHGFLQKHHTERSNKKMLTAADQKTRSIRGSTKTVMFKELVHKRKELWVKECKHTHILTYPMYTQTYIHITCKYRCILGK